MFDHALPFWWRVGADHQTGGFHEKIDQQGCAVGTPLRARVQARQIYVYATAGRMGWSGPWQDAVAHGLSFLLEKYPRGDGLFLSSIGSDTFDLYDQAFVLFALAHAYAATGRPPELLGLAYKLIARLDELLAHPEGGYEEDVPRCLPLKSNPHMHLLEALLAWVEIGADELFCNKAKAIVKLATAKLIDAETGAIGEYYDGDWALLTTGSGAIREPGHQFEWAYLLLHSERLLGVNTVEQAYALEAFGSRHGISPTTKSAIFSVDAAGNALDGRSRIWAQTERLRTALAFTRYCNDERTILLEVSLLESIESLQKFLSTPIEGMWWEWMAPDGTFISEPSPASSLYHVVTALSELAVFDQEIPKYITPDFTF